MCLEELSWSRFLMIKYLKLSVTVNDVMGLTRRVFMMLFDTDVSLHFDFFQKGGKKKRKECRTGAHHEEGTD